MMCARKYRHRHFTSDLYNLLFLIQGKQVGDFPCIEQAVHVLEERLLLDLRVGEEEHRCLAVLSHLLEEGLEVILPLGVTVALGDLRLVEGREGGRSGEEEGGRRSRRGG